MIVPAAKCEELMKEGRALHHCVGAGDTYMARDGKRVQLDPLPAKERKAGSSVLYH